MKRKTKIILATLGGLYLGSSFWLGHQGDNIHDRKMAEVRERPMLSQTYEQKRTIGRQYLDYQNFLNDLDQIKYKETITSLDCVVQKKSEAETQIPELITRLIETQAKIDSLETADPELNKLNQEYTDFGLSAVFPPYYLIKRFLND